MFEHLSRHRYRHLPLLGGNDAIKETCMHCAFGAKDFAINNAAIKEIFREVIAAHFNTEIMHGHADKRFIKADFIITFFYHGIITGQSEERAHRNGVTRSRHDYGTRISH